MKPTIAKEPSMLRQKDMVAGHYHKLGEAQQAGHKVAYTFVPGNLTELMLSFDLLPVYPEINALQNAMRKLSGDYIAEAERAGHSEDVCTYVKCDIGMMLKGNTGPTGEKMPPPDVLLLSYTGCFTFMKWFELLREKYRCPTAMLHVPYMPDGVVTKESRDYVVKQLKDVIIPALEKSSGKKYDEERLRAMLALSAKAEDDLVAVLESAKQRPSPIDAYFGGVYYIGPLFTAFRGTQDAVDYYRELREEVEARIARGEGPITPEGQV
jgi:benzoyl-CoA reductase subunit B